MFDVAQELRTEPEPFLKWAGGKGQLLNQFENLFPKTFNRYYEPFLGSGAVFFRLKPPRAVLNDVNPNLTYAYLHIQSQLDELLTILHKLRESYRTLNPSEQQRRYYQVRAEYNELSAGSIEKTALLIFLNKTGYNGLYRESKKGGFNVPFGRYTNPAIFDERKLRIVSHALQGVELLNTGFSKAVETAQKGDFVYFDPPYVPLNKTSSFTSYTRHDFGENDQIELANIFQELTERGVLAMLSNAATDSTRKLYKDFFQHEVFASRIINSKADRRGKIAEIVVTNYL